MSTDKFIETVQSCVHAYELDLFWIIVYLGYLYLCLISYFIDMIMIWAAQFCETGPGWMVPWTGQGNATLRIDKWVDLL